jgi:NAD(P)-dependent dehydrogenase (short-subunit alcohol dehydrogenase family)
VRRPLEGKAAIVTGAGRGLGRAHALALAAAGARVVVNDIGASISGEGFDGEPAAAVAAEIERAGGEAVVYVDDVASFDGARCLVQHAVEAFGRLDILVNNAGNLRDRMLVNMAEEDWNEVVRVHLNGHFAPTRHAAALWRERAKSGEEVRGRVINTSSPAGLFGSVGQSSYGTAKAGIVSFTLTAAQELGRYGVTVNSLVPIARTRMMESAFVVPATDGFDPFDPANISPLVVALCDDAAQRVTGQVFQVWGGRINALRGWTAGVSFENDGRWEPAVLLDELVRSFADGIAPDDLVTAVASAGGVELERLA